MPAGTWLAPMPGDVVRILRRFGALDIAGGTGSAEGQIGGHRLPCGAESKEDALTDR